MLTAEENELLTRVGPGTPCGTLFRRYWQPVGLVHDLKERPTHFVRIMGEDLVLFKDLSGRVGLIADHCSHRGASLLYGRVEERGIACAYHGWLYDAAGHCLETPAEPADSLFHLTVRHPAYPVQEYCGLYWAYMGPQPAPLLPRLDLAERGELVAVARVPREDCNWLQVVENNLDMAHVFILHQDVGVRGLARNTTRGLIDVVERLDYFETPNGIRREKLLRDGTVERDLLIFPNNQRLVSHFSVKVPIDDTHTCNYRVFFNLDLPGARLLERTDGDVQVWLESTDEGKDPPDATYPLAHYRMDALRFQDFMVFETQGPVARREVEHLGTSDKGVVLFRQILKREIEKVQAGQDPIGVVRDPADEVINTFIDSLDAYPPRGMTQPVGVRLYPHA